ncbi:hypothetical protein THIX_10188 [Thiomonas sp. X19]|nr:hypothetical protein THIX_10188 [Thiomonas sp. X19]
MPMARAEASRFAPSRSIGAPAWCANGRRQAARLPNALRFKRQSEGLIERERIRIVLRPKPGPGMQQWIDAFDSFSEREQQPGHRARERWCACRHAPDLAKSLAVVSMAAGETAEGAVITPSRRPRRFRSRR